MFSGLFGFNAVFNIVACFTAPLVIRKLGNRPTTILALSILVLSAAITVAGQQFGPSTGMMAAFAFMLPMLMLGVGFSFLLGPATSMALSAFGERAGTAAAMLGFIQMSGASVLAGLVQQTNLTAPYAVALVMGVFPIGLLLMMALSRFDHWHQEQLAGEH